ncbi:MAG: L-2-hydroxyglutarate oxidase [Planctomycetota bacterium]
MCACAPEYRSAGAAYQPFDLAVVGAGLIGLATAMRYLQRRAESRVVVLEQESSPVRHQSGHNSGVIHSGIYYRPGSEKAELCRRGREDLEAFCKSKQIDWQRCGKVIVATRESELEALEQISARGLANGIDHVRLNTDQLRAREPAAAGIAALEVRSTGIVDYRAVGRAIGSVVDSLGGSIRTNATVMGMTPTDRVVQIVLRGGERLESRSVIACAGLRADQLYALANPSAEKQLAIVPFRGEYYSLRKAKRDLCRHLIYPVPDPSFPFLGVHFTRGTDGSVHCGPNAVFAMAREGYRWRDFNWDEFARTMAFPGFRRLAQQHWRKGLAEINRSVRKSQFVAALKRLVPSVQSDDLVRSPAGVRAQAVKRDGSLVDDFWFESTPRMTHVLNAPSPAATACLAIADRIVDTHLRNNE